MIPYGRQSIDNKDIEEVVKVLRSEWLTTGPNIEAFEEAIRKYTGAKNAVSVSNGTAALHTAMRAAEIRPGDEVIVPPITFVASANAAIYQGAIPVFVDVRPDDLLIDLNKVEELIGPRTKALVSVDYSGHPCDYDELRRIADKYDLALISDACHALGAEYKGKMVGTQADLTCLSFHPVKHITTGEGGMVLTQNGEMAIKMRRFRNHGINKTFRERNGEEAWYYEMVDLGFNYRLTDIQCALGISQLRKAPKWLSRRREIAKAYDETFRGSGFLEPLTVQNERKSAYHLYVVKVDTNIMSRSKLFSSLRQKGIGVNVHYIPVHLHPFYQEKFGTRKGLCPVAEVAYERIISLPIFGTMTDEQVTVVIKAVTDLLKK